MKNVKIHAGNCNTSNEEVKQQSFSREEVLVIIKRVAIECMMQCNEVRDEEHDEDMNPKFVDGICSGANRSKYFIAKTFGIDVKEVW
jgi:hypothetical protein